MVWTEEAKEIFDTWYNALARAASDDETGMRERQDSHVLKVAMLIHLARSKSLQLDPEDIVEAIEEVAKLTNVSTGRTSNMGDNTTPTQKSKARVLEVILRKDKLSRREILQRVDVLSDELDPILATLQEANLVVEIKEKGKLYYSATPECLARLKRGS
jgi:hypothetical protein